jgi:hypothetical protein
MSDLSFIFLSVLFLCSSKVLRICLPGWFAVNISNLGCILSEVFVFQWICLAAIEEQPTILLSVVSGYCVYLWHLSDSVYSLRICFLFLHKFYLWKAIR